MTFKELDTLIKRLENLDEGDDMDSLYSRVLEAAEALKYLIDCAMTDSAAYALYEGWPGEQIMVGILPENEVHQWVMEKGKLPRCAQAFYVRSTFNKLQDEKEKQYDKD